jgi:hypothetical protein
MAFEETVQSMRQLLLDLSKDLEKSFVGNKSASQRVRVNSVMFEKISKTYRRESLELEKEDQAECKEHI